MTKSKGTNLEEFYNDFIITSFSILILFVAVVIIVSVFTGKLGVSLSNGLFWGLGLELFMFY